MEGFLYLALVCAGAFLMLDSGVGPFAHFRFISLTEHYRTININRRRAMVITAWLIVIIGLTHVIGIWTLDGLTSLPPSSV